MLWESFHLPSDLENALRLKARFGASARFVAGGTDLIVDLEHGRLATQAMQVIDISRLPTLRGISEEADGLRLGGGVTHADLLRSPLVAKYAGVLAQAAVEVGAPQIRNRSTLAGNLVTASPAADTIPPLLALNATIELVSERGQREIAVKDFLRGFRKVAIASDELVRSIFIPYPQGERRGVFLKLGLRKAQAIAVINVCAVLELDAAGKISAANIALGSVAATTLVVPGVIELLSGNKLTDELIEQVATLAMATATPIDDVRGSAIYRKAMVKTFTARALRYIRDAKTPLPSADPNIFLQVPDVSSTSTPHAPSGNAELLEMEVNGQLVQIAEAHDKVLLYALRQAGFKGTKEGCFEGECGACTVLLDGYAVNSCLVPAFTAQGCQVQTVEGLAGPHSLHPLQQSFVEQGGVQCGFCTPGLLMAGSTLLAERPQGASEWECRSALVGNLCRCTGYSKVLAAMAQA